MKNPAVPTIAPYILEEATIRAEIYLSYFTVIKNLSFLVSDMAKELFQKMFCDSKIAQNIILNPNKDIIENVLAKYVNEEKYLR